MNEQERERMKEVCRKMTEELLPIFMESFERVMKEEKEKDEDSTNN